MVHVPASIRFKNPGAMWGNKLAIKWGADPHPVTLNDGKGQGNNIAVFPTFVQGICAQMDLWRTSPNYRNKRFGDAIAVWSGHNSVEQYIAFVTKRAPGITRDTVMDDAFWRGSNAIPFLKAQAGHEAGQVYPAPDEDWVEAKKRVLAGATAQTVTKHTASVVVAAPIVVAASHSGLSTATALLIGLGVGLAVGALYEVYRVLKNRHLTAVAPPVAQTAPIPTEVPILIPEPVVAPTVEAKEPTNGQG